MRLFRKTGLRASLGDGKGIGGGGEGVAHRGAGCAVSPSQGKALDEVYMGLAVTGGAVSPPFTPHTPCLFPLPVAHWEGGGGWGWPLHREASSRATAGIALFAGVFE